MHRPFQLWRRICPLSIFGLPLLFVVAVAPLTASPSQEAAAEIRTVMDAQQTAWNRGDLEGFMRGYRRSQGTVFVSGDTVTRGWQTVLDRYKKKYASVEQMGRLRFSDLEITLLSPDTAVVLGRWALKRANDHPHGRFTLLFHHLPDGWRIVHDHTSAATP